MTYRTVQENESTQFLNEGTPLSVQAYNYQGSNKYTFMDNYHNVMLQKGTRIGCLVIYRGKTQIGDSKVSIYERGSYYFDMDSYKKCMADYNKTSFTDKELNEFLQIDPWFNPTTKSYQYKNHLAVFEVKCDIEVATSITLANPQFGQGGIQQVFIPTNEQHFPAIITEGYEDEYFKLDHVKELVKENLDLVDYYNSIDIKHDYILSKRNLFCYLKVKADLLQIIQNSKVDATIDKAQFHLKQVDKHIEKYYIEIDKFRKNQIFNDNVNTKDIDSLIRYLDRKVEALGDGQTLFLADEDKEKEIAQKSVNIFRKVNKDLKKEDGEREMKELDDAFDSSRLSDRYIHTERIDFTKEFDFSDIKYVASVTQEGISTILPVNQAITPADPSKELKLSNGTMTELVSIGGDGNPAKLLVRGSLLIPIHKVSEEDLKLNLLNKGIKATDELLNKLKKDGIPIGRSNMLLKLDEELNRIYAVSNNRQVIQTPIIRMEEKEMNIMVQREASPDPPKKKHGPHL